jgi:hypothetical protein
VFTDILDLDHLVCPVERVGDATLPTMQAVFPMALQSLVGDNIGVFHQSGDLFVNTFSDLGVALSDLLEPPSGPLSES